MQTQNPERARQHEQFVRAGKKMEVAPVMDRRAPQQPKCTATGLARFVQKQHPKWSDSFCEAIAFGQLTAAHALLEADRVYARLFAGEALSADTILRERREAIGLEEAAKTHKRPEIREIQDEVARFYHTQGQWIRGTSRRKHIVLPRQVSFYIAHNIYGYTLPEIGRRTGRRDHTTVLHGVRKVEKNANPRHLAKIQQSLDDLMDRKKRGQI